MSDGERYVLQEELYKTVEGEIVRAGTGRADSLYKPVGAKIPRELADKLGLPLELEAAGEGESEGADQVDLDDLTRDQLNDKATELGIEKPEKLKAKSDVITAIEAAQELEAAGEGESD